MTELKNIGERLDQIKKHFNYTNEQLGEICGVSYAAIRKIVNGETKDPSVSIIMHLRRKLGINLEWLLFEEGEMFEGPQKNKSTEKGKKHIINISPPQYMEVYKQKESMHKLMLQLKDEEIQVLKKMVNVLEKKMEDFMSKKKQAS